MARRTKVKGSARLYDAYLFRDKDPAIDEFRTVAQDHFGTHNLSPEDYEEIHENGGPTGACIKSWFEGKTRRPQNATLEAAGRALGFKRVWVRNKNGNY